MPPKGRRRMFFSVTVPSPSCVVSVKPSMGLNTGSRLDWGGRGMMEKDECRNQNDE